MVLTGWSLPQSPGGTAALVPPPPWHFSGEVLGIDFRTDPNAVAAILPPPMTPAEDGWAAFVFCEWSASASADHRLADDPGRGQYREAYVIVAAQLDGRRVGRVPYIWVDSDLSLVRGHLQGFPKKLGHVAISRAVTVGRGGPRLAPGERFAGHVSSLGRRLATGSVVLEGQGVADDVPLAMCLPVWHTRLVPDLAGGPPLVHDLARNVVADFEIAEVWRGDAELELLASEFEEHADLAPLEVSSGFRCAVAFSITGAEVRPLRPG